MQRNDNKNVSKISLPKGISGGNAKILSQSLKFGLFQLINLRAFLASNPTTFRVGKIAFSYQILQFIKSKFIVFSCLSRLEFVNEGKEADSLVYN